MLALRRLAIAVKIVNICSRERFARKKSRRANKFAQWKTGFRLKWISGFSNFTMYVDLQSFVEENLTTFFPLMHYLTIAMLTLGNNVKVNIGQKYCMDSELFEISEGL